MTMVMSPCRPLGRLIVVRRDQPPTSEPSTRTRILRAAERLFAEHGFHGTCLREIAAAVGIRKASLFHYFPGKENLYRTVLLEHIAEVREALEHAAHRPAPYHDRLRRLIATYVALVAARRPHTQMLLRQTLESPSAVEPAQLDLGPLLALAVEFVRAGQRAGAFRDTDPVPPILTVVAAAAFYFTAVPRIAPRWTDGAGSDAAYAAAVTAHLVDVAERVLLVEQPSPHRGAGGLPHGLQPH